MISKNEALTRFENVLEKVQRGGTPFREVVSFPINELGGAVRALSFVKNNNALWQHTPTSHTACIYIKKGTGFAYNRVILNLIASHIDTSEKFLELWDFYNKEAVRGDMPKSVYQPTDNVRKQNGMYIVANQAVGNNPESKIAGNLPVPSVDRTHLIPAQVTGIEGSEGFLIDFDGWLNRTAMRKFENKILKLTEEQDLIWVCNVWKVRNDSRGKRDSILEPEINPWRESLHLKYEILDNNYTFIERREWVDDRWQYIWKYKDYQKRIDSFKK